MSRGSVNEPNARVAHIGVAVADLKEAITFYRSILEIEPSPLETADGAKIVSVPLGDVDIELLEPETPDGPIGKFMAKRGPGIHHICFRVPDLDDALERCRRRGYEPIDETPRLGVGGRRIVFLHPKSTSGILLELTE